MLQDRGHCGCVPGCEGTPHSKAGQCAHSGKYEFSMQKLFPSTVQLTITSHYTVPFGSCNVPSGSVPKPTMWLFGPTQNTAT